MANLIIADVQDVAEAERIVTAERKR